MRTTLSTFTADATRGLGGPDWLARRRSEAWERFSAAALPTEDEEVWRYSGINGFDLDAYRPAPPADGPGDALARARRVAAAFGPAAALVVTVNGSVVALERGPSAPDELTVSAAPGAAAEVAGALGSLAPARDAFGHLHDAFLADVVAVEAPRKAVVADPVVVVHLVEPRPGGGVAAFPHTLVRLGTSAEAGVIEVLASAVDGEAAPALALPVTELEVSDDAHLRYANLQTLDAGATAIAVQASRVGQGAGLRSFTAGLGGRYARVRTDSDLVGTGGHTSLLAAYLGTGSQRHDFRTLQDHHAGRTESELLFKGAVADTARSVYSGLIRIRHGARGANAFQTNHNLVLSEGAHADSVPNLDIDENDVRCSHASTVGPIDEEQRYYLETRGIEPEVAERLIVLGFFADLAGRAPLAGVGAWVEDKVRRRLGALGAQDGTGDG
ncbi:MAG TPA: SufD family Fe-S cluster assembly protein [Acidimicrobiales bacterium]|nr:SufD family Fe-S cluster assembly protein [Acidimicrobiales bacterium]